MRDRPTTLEPRDWARRHLHGYAAMDFVPYGYKDLVHYINSGMSGFFGTVDGNGDGVKVACSVAHDLRLADGRPVRIRYGEVGVVLDGRISGVYKIADIISELRSGVRQVSLFGEVA